MGRPKARRQNVRVLSRRSNLPKAVACGYSEGAGFTCSNGTLPLALGPSALGAVHDSSTRRWRGVSHAPGVCALGCVYGATPRLVAAPPQQRPRRESVGAAATPPDGVGTVRSQSTWALGAACQVGRPRAISRGRKKRAATASGAEDTSRRPRRALPRAGDGWLPPCGFSHSCTGPEAMGTAG